MLLQCYTLCVMTSEPSSVVVLFFFEDFSFEAVGILNVELYCLPLDNSLPLVTLIKPSRLAIFTPTHCLHTLIYF